MEWMEELTDLDSISSRAKADFGFHKGLSHVSNSEIKSLLNNVNFYIEHFSILNKKRKSIEFAGKVTFLQKMAAVLCDEMQSRSI